MPDNIPASYLYVFAIAFGAILVLARVLEAMVLKKKRNGSGPELCALFDDKKWQSFQELLIKKLESDNEADRKRWDSMAELFAKKMDGVGEKIDRGFHNLTDQFERMSERTKESLSSISECNRGIKSDIASVRGIMLEIKAGRAD